MLGHRAARRHYQAVENVRSCAFSTSQVRRMSVLARANQALARPIRGSAIHGRSWQAVFNGLLYLIYRGYSCRAAHQFWLASRYWMIFYSAKPRMVVPDCAPLQASWRMIS